MSIWSVIREGARSQWVVADALRKTGLLGSVPMRGVARMAKEWRRIPSGPSAILAFHALANPDKEALVCGDVRLSFLELDGAINRLANGLHSLGVRPGDRVALMMKNCHAYLISQWAVARLGALAVQIGYRLKAGEVSHILENSEPIALLYHAEYEEVVEEATKRYAPKRVNVPREFEQLLASSPADPPPQVKDERGGVIIYTSGTTGKPKGAARDFQKKNVHAAVADLMRQVGIHHRDRHLVVCPLYHSAAPAFMALTYMVGGTVVLLDHFDPETVLETIAREKITSAFFVPTMLGRLAAVDLRSRYDTSSLRWVVCGAAPLPTDTARRFEAAFGRILYNFYGATETGMVTLALPGEHTARPGTIGRKLAGNEIRLVSESGREVPAGEVGELFVRNSMLVSGYHRNGQATREAMREGFFSVGDLARRDADGYYYLADRKHDMIISGGVNIYPLEIEQHLHSHPSVLECAVVGVPDPDWGEAVKAFVVKRSGVSSEELRDYCKGALAGYKCPRQFEFIDVLPRTPTGKVLRRELRER